MSSKTFDDESIVRSLIAVSHLSPDENEVEAAIAGYATTRASIDRLYSVPLDHEEDLTVALLG